MTRVSSTDSEDDVDDDSVIDRFFELLHLEIVSLDQFPTSDEKKNNSSKPPEKKSNQIDKRPKEKEKSKEKQSYLAIKIKDGFCHWCEKKLTEEHTLTNCDTLVKAPNKDVLGATMKYNLCSNCFKIGHKCSDCPDESNCDAKGCTLKHAKKLHRLLETKKKKASNKTSKN